ncbi:MAG: N-acetyl-gamma-glutamyl-phosphate reductase [Bdellovibrionales bacterium]|nr:N-acetyl-gamma-glutamyl-phosphate reductase [Bdellovibrionales bacterium]
MNFAQINIKMLEMCKFMHFNRMNEARAGFHPKETGRRKIKGMTMKKVAIVGWSGYSGLELARLALRHPQMELAACFSRNQETHLPSLLPGAPSVQILSTEELSQRADQFDTIFFATPTEASLELIPHITSSTARIIDLSGGFRCKKDVVYGLQPFCNSKAQFIANPGCYVTSVLMALVPLVKASLIDTTRIVIDAKSGSSGAGKSLRSDLLFCEVEGNCLPYKVAQHQHLPEILYYMEEFAGLTANVLFTPHLMPFKRGIISSIYAQTKGSESDLTQVYSEAYKDYPLVSTQSLSEGSNLLLLSKVVGTPRTHISFKVVDGELYLFSCIDNLLKGAASQAIENWNVQNDLPPQYGLEVYQ